MPKGLVFGALALLALVVLALTWMNNRSLEPDEVLAEADNVAAPVENMAAPAPAAPPAQATGPVVLTATDAVWLQVRDGGVTLKQGQLAAGESYEVPANAVAPQLTTGKPEALRITVGSQQAPAIGEAGKRVSNVSLKAPDLMRAPTGATSAPSQGQVSPAVRQAPRTVEPSRTPAPPPVQNPDPNTPTNSASGPTTGAAEPAVQ